MHTYVVIPLTRFGNFHSSLMFLQKSIWIYVVSGVTFQSSDFLTRDKISSPTCSSSIFPLSWVSTLAEKMVGMHTLMTILSPIMKISQFFPNCAQSDCQSSAMLPLAPPVGSLQSFFPTIWGQQVWEPIQLQGNLRSRAHFKSFLDALIAPAPSLQWSVMGTDILPCLCNWT